ncbi:hypothetical protein BD770DRAFT_386512 [Pilaira anomala]|nr:hypothetical protein BD770DRAFT_386512 [Pilaira anomala]
MYANVSCTLAESVTLSLQCRMSLSILTNSYFVQPSLDDLNYHVESFMRANIYIHVFKIVY